MNAILLSAGFGTRLRPLTNFLPKCLAPIYGIPILEIWLRKLETLNIDNIFVNTHYLSNLVTEHINNHDYSKPITILHESMLLGTGGTLSSLPDQILDEDLIVIHADNLSSLDLDNFAKFHESHDAKLSMMTFITDTPSSCGIATWNEQKRLISFEEKPTNAQTNTANGAVYVFDSRLLQMISSSPDKYQDISTGVITSELFDDIMIFEGNCYHKDIGNPTEFLKANSCELNWLPSLTFSPPNKEPSPTLLNSYKNGIEAVTDSVFARENIKLFHTIADAEVFFERESNTAAHIYLLNEAASYSTVRELQEKSDSVVLPLVPA